MIAVEGLSKRYGDRDVVHDVSFTCEPGTITGFLGPNGAGKSTTLRMLTGLTQPSAGRSTILGVRYAELKNPGRAVGVVLDQKALHPGRTVIGTLRLAAECLGEPASRADQVLSEVGLAGARRQRVQRCSLGMRQRLLLGVALMGSPTVLILDEPVNGLDPGGVAWLRSVLQQFACDGGTVLLSSHLLSEVQTTVDRVVVLNQGRCVAAGLLSELAPASVVVRTVDEAKLRTALDRDAIVHEVRDGAVHITASALHVGRIIAAHGIVITSMTEGTGAALENIFFQVTAGTSASKPFGRGTDHAIADLASDDTEVVHVGSAQEGTVG